MKNKFLKIFSPVLVAVVIGGGFLFKSQNAYSLSAILSVLSGINNYIEEYDKLAQLAAILGVTTEQLTNLENSLEIYRKQEENLDKLKQDITNITSLLRTSKQVYYAGQSVGRFYSGINDYWNYAKERGFSSLPTAIRTVNRGLRLGQGVLRDAIAIANIIAGFDEDGHKVDFDAATRSSRIRSLFNRINDAQNKWAGMVGESGVMSAGTEADVDVMSEFLEPGGFFNPSEVHISYLLKKPAELKDMDLLR